jgi:hypothetical protein
MFLLVVGFAAPLALSSCATSATQEIPDSPDNSLIIGRVNVDISVTSDYRVGAITPIWSLLEIQFKQVSPATDAPFRQAIVDNGYFYFETVPGTYRLADLKYGDYFLFVLPTVRAELSYPFDGSRSPLDFQVGPAAVQCLGAKKIVRNTFLKTVEIVPQESMDFPPSEQTMLSWLLKHIKNRKRWERVIMQRLNQIGGPVAVY